MSKFTNEHNNTTAAQILPPQTNNSGEILTTNGSTVSWATVTGGGSSTTSVAIYVIELSRWGISNDFTNPLQVSNGINNALQWASDNHYTEVILPKGNYLIEKNTPIKPPSDIVLNLGGSTLQIESNGLLGYDLILLDTDQKNVIIKNGNLVGDRYTHDYTEPGTHEWGNGIVIYGACQCIYMQNLHISDCTGDAIVPESTFGWVTDDYEIRAAQLTLGAIDNITGDFLDSTDLIRTITPLTLTAELPKKVKYIGLYGAGYGSLPGVTTKLYSAYFYKSDNTFVSCVELLKFYEEAPIPDNADKVHFVIYQNTIPADFFAEARCPTFPQYIYITNNNLHHCRRQGISVCGARYVYIRGNNIHDINGTDPQGGIDVEDGYDINQHIYIQDNHFYNNVGYNIVTVAGRYFVITGNQLRGVTKYVGVTFDARTCQILMSNNIIDRCSVALSGEVIFSNNWVYGSPIDIGNEINVQISGCTFHNVRLRTGGTKPYSTKIDNCRFYNDADKKVAFPELWTTFYFTSIPILMTNCIVEGNDINYCSFIEDSITDGYIFENVTFINTTDNGFPPGQFINCKFITSTPLSMKNAGDYLLKGCYFKQLDTGIIISGDCKNVKIYNSFFDSLGEVGYGNASIFVKNANQVIIDGNTINAPALNNTNFSLIEAQSTFTGSLLLITNNTIVTNKACRGINTSAVKATKPCIVKNNNLIGGCTLKLRAGDVNIRNDLN